MFPDSGFNEVLSRLRNKVQPETSSRGPATAQESQNVREGFQLFALYLIEVIDGTGVVVS
jgi:hypothetical protein